MNDENEKIDRKQYLKEKKELKMLERFQYDDKEKSLRESTRKIIYQENFYTGLIKGIPPKIENEKNPSRLNGKKRGRKPKKQVSYNGDEHNKKNEIKSNGKEKKISSKQSKNDLGNFFKDTKFDHINSQTSQEESYEIGAEESKFNGNNKFEFDKNISDVNYDNLDNEENKKENSQISNCDNEISNQTDSYSYVNNKGIRSLDMSHTSILKNQIKLKIKNSENNLHNNLADCSQDNEETKKIKNGLEEGYKLELEKYGATIDKNNEHANYSNLTSVTYINCDLRFFNYDLITSRIGFFDVIMMDPPWRIKGGQRNDSSFMFSNSKFNLEYNTLSNNEIISIPVEKLSKKGFCFLWVLNSLMNVGYECLNKWGYDVVDQITWVKTRNEKLYISQGYYFLHSSETCLIGYKCPPNERVEYKSKVKY
jgi:predicted RNA methylase